MVQFCCVAGCGNRSNRDKKKFYRLPIVPKHCTSKEKAELFLRRRKQWLANIDRVDLKDGDSSYSKGYIRLCSDHFFGGKPSALTDIDHPDWAPTVKMGKGTLKLKGTKVKRASYGFRGTQKRDKRCKAATAKNYEYIQINSNKIDTEEKQRLLELAMRVTKMIRNKAYIPVALRDVRTPEKLPPIVNRVAKKTFMQRKQSQMNNSKRFAVKKIQQWKNSVVCLKPGTVILLINNKLEVCGIGGNSMTSKPAIIHKITTDCINTIDNGELCDLSKVDDNCKDCDLSNQSMFESHVSKSVSEIYDSQKVNNEVSICDLSNQTTNMKLFEVCDTNKVDDGNEIYDANKVNDEDKICDISNRTSNFTQFESLAIKSKTIHTDDDEISIICEIMNEHLPKIKTEKENFTVSLDS